MKKIIAILSSLFIILSLSAQLPYNWAPGVDPGWSSTNVGSGGGLQWRTACNAVTTNCNGQYSNNQNTTYTSFIIDASCANATTLNISFFISGNAENGWDFLFIEYSLDGGLTWVNPYGVNVGLTGNAGAGITWNLPPIPTSNTFRFRFNFVSDASVRASGYRITGFQILCNIVLPIELLSFTGKQMKDYNYIEWITASEINNDYFTLERSNDGKNWKRIHFINGAGNSNKQLSYEIVDRDYPSSINYYRLTQFDFDGVSEIFNPVSIDNRSDKYLVKIINILGQEVDERYNGIVIKLYNDGSIEKIWK
jgi:hypothetical protein